MLNNQMYLKLLQKEQFKKKATGDLIGNKNANKITKKSPQNTSEMVDSETEIPTERYISPEERQKIIDELKVI